MKTTLVRLGAGGLIPVTASADGCTVTIAAGSKSETYTIADAGTDAQNAAAFVAAHAEDIQKTWNILVEAAAAVVNFYSVGDVSITASEGTVGSAATTGDVAFNPAEIVSVTFTSATALTVVLSTGTLTITSLASGQSKVVEEIGRLMDQQANGGIVTLDAACRGEIA